MNWLPLSRLLSAGRSPAHTVAFRDGTKLDMAGLRHDVQGAAYAIGPGEPAMLACRDSYNFVVGLLALLHAGRDIVLPANTQPGTLAGHPGPLIDDVWLARPPGGLCPLEPFDPNRRQIVLFTSGSTGTPKALPKTAGMLEREGAALHTAWSAMAGAGPVHATVSHQHMYGLACKILWPLTAGIPFAAETHDVWETLLPALTPGAVIVTSPAHLTRLGGLVPLTPDRRPNLILTAGAPLPLTAAHDAATISGRLPLEMFGSSETGAVATRRQEHGNEAWGPLPGSECRTDPDGCLSVRSPYTAGWQTTGDRAEMDGTGFRLLGRADDVLKIEGQRVTPFQVEQALLALPLVDAAAVILAPDSSGRLAAVVVPSTEAQAVLAAEGAFRFGRRLRRALAETLAPAVIPRRWRFVDTLPTRALGKRDAAALAALFRPTS